MTSTGKVGIGTTPTGSQKLNVQGGVNTFKYNTTRDSLELAFWATDPRILARDMVVFYNHNHTGYIDIKCKTLYEHSDISKKENIKNLNSSLEKVKALNGVSYNWKNDKTKTPQIGLIAQSVQSIVPEVVETVDSTGELSVSYTHLVPLLIEAIKEQDKKIETLNKSLELTNKSARMDASFSLDVEIVSSLSQNIPNPFTEKTVIPFTIGKDVNNAIIYIFDMNGKMLKAYNLQPGTSELEISGNSYQPGMYIYTLVCDGKEINTKRMILTE